MIWTAAVCDGWERAPMRSRRSSNTKPTSSLTAQLYGLESNSFTFKALGVPYARLLSVCSFGKHGSDLAHHNASRHLQGIIISPVVLGTAIIVATTLLTSASASLAPMLNLIRPVLPYLSSSAGYLLQQGHSRTQSTSI